MGNKDAYLYIPDDVVREAEQDAFGHAHIADAVVQSILNTSPPFTIGIFGGWGTGKSSILTLIRSELKRKHVRSVWIDAWRYSSAESLRRAFLVHVASEISPKRLSELRAKLYTTAQESVPHRPSKLDDDESTGLWDFIKSFTGAFLGIGAIFLIVLVILYWVRSLLPGGSFDALDVIDKSINLVYVPIALALINSLRPYLSRSPVTVTHERIDADELLASIFKKVVIEAIRCPFPSRRRLVIFVDNLDRLNDDKMVEALEALKTYIYDDNCIFVVACDDNVVRSVMGGSEEDRPADGSQTNAQRQTGEEYLDKFFQQTFRLPAYMEIDLVDFAEKQFSGTRLCATLEAEGISARYLLSVILPADISSPRKIKRLLNEFIATYEMVRRRESESGGQLRPRALTATPEFLGKISTIRAEFPRFYEKLVDNPELLEEVTELIRTQKTDYEFQEKLKGYVNEAKLGSLVGYLRKTQTVTVAEIEPYIWLSQDTLTLGLKPEQSRKLRISLSNGNDEEVIDMLTSTPDDSERALLAQVASRYVEHRLRGLEQQNGVIVLSRILDHLDSQMRNEVAQVAANLIPQLRLDPFTTEDVLRVLQSAKRGENKKLIDALMRRFDDDSLREETFDAILSFWDVIDVNGATPQVQNWLRNVLSPEEQLKQPNQDFALWLVGEVKEHDGEHEVIERYFAQDLTDYVTDRLMSRYEGLPAIDLETEEGQLFKEALATIGRYSETERSTRFWDALETLLGSASSEHYDYGSSMLKEHLDVVPHDSIDQLVEAITSGMSEVSETVSDAPDEWVVDELAVVERLCEAKGSCLGDNARRSLENALVELGRYDELNGSILRFADRFISRFERENGNAVIRGICSIFSDIDTGLENDKAYLELLIKYEQRLDNDLRSRIIDAIDNCARSNDPSHVNRAWEYLGQIIEIKSFQGSIERISLEWLDLIAAAHVPLLKARVDLVLTSFSAGFVTADVFAERMIAPFPFGGNQQQLEVAVGALEQLSDGISDSIGLRLFQQLLPHFGHYGPLLPRILVLMSRWNNLAAENERNRYISTVLGQFNAWPEKIVGILPTLWSSMDVPQVQQQVIAMYQKDLDADYKESRDSAAQAGLAALDGDEKTKIVRDVWTSLQPTGNAAEQFMKVARKELSLKEINALRNEALALVRESGAKPSAEMYLRLLAATVRSDVREVMQVVSLFENLFGRGEEEVKLASKYVVRCLKPMDLKSYHKHRLAEAMSEASLRLGSQISEQIHEVAKELGLIGWRAWAYRKYWRS